MPYIKQKERPKCDLIVQQMIDSNIQANGDLNYILYKFCKLNTKSSYKEN